MGWVGNVLLPLPQLGKAFKGLLEPRVFLHRAQVCEVVTGGHKARDVT